MTDPSPLILELTPELTAAAKERVENNLSGLIDKLSKTVFYKESPALAAIRDANGVGLTSEDEQLPQRFYANVSFTSYEDYSSFISRFFEKPCRKSDVEDLLSPGLPLFLAHTSGTSGSAPKYFPKYPNPLYAPKPWDGPDAPKVTVCGFSGIRLNKLIETVDNEGQVVQVIPDTIVSSGSLREHYGIGPKDDEKIVTQKAKFSPIPFAVWLLPSYQSNIYMNAFFAIIDPSVICMHAMLSTILFDAIRTIEQNWDTMIHAIEEGSLPYVDELGEYRTHLERFVEPNPARAAELRNINPGSEGWLKKIWPSLAIVMATLSGQYASLQPKLRYHFGPGVLLTSVTFAATESAVGVGYDPTNTNLYRLDSNEHIELLDIEKDRSPENLSQPWQVKSGRKYEIFVTTNDGLWRYALSDVVEVAGFSPVDGQPLIKYCERKGVGFRVAGEFVSESYLRQIMASLSDTLGPVVEFTAEVDDRKGKGLGAYGFFVELAGEPEAGYKGALTKVQDFLLENVGYKKYFDSGFIGEPTIRIVAPGTFKAYREWKTQKSGFPVGQVKVPTTIVDVETRQWMAKRVSVEIGVQPDA